MAMLAYITGKVIHLDTSTAILLTNNLGYKVNITIPTAFKLALNDNISLWLYNHIKEDQNSLFGFENIEELKMFELLISVSGVGPKSALTLLSTNTIKNVATALSQSKPELLAKAPGLGKKTLEKMCIELREKVSNFETHEISGASNEAKLALESLGYSSKDIQAALASIAPKDTDDINTIIKQALKYLG